MRLRAMPCMLFVMFFAKAGKTRAGWPVLLRTAGAKPFQRGVNKIRRGCLNRPGRLVLSVFALSLLACQDPPPSPPPASASNSPAPQQKESPPSASRSADSRTADSPAGSLASQAAPAEKGQTGAAEAKNSLDSPASQAAPEGGAGSPEIMISPPLPALTEEEMAIPLERFIDENMQKLKGGFGIGSPFDQGQFLRSFDLFQQAPFYSRLSPISREFYFAAAYMHLQRIFWGDLIQTRLSAALAGSSLSETEKKSRAKAVFETAVKELKAWSFFDYFQKSLSKDIMLESVKLMSSMRAPITITVKKEGEEAFSVSRMSHGGQEIYSVSPEETEGPFGRLAPLGSLAPPADYIYQQTIEERHLIERAVYQGIIDNLIKNKSKAIAVNIFDNRSAAGMMRLARHIKKTGMDVYVLGHCSLTCSSYLLPAAKNVYIGLYGVISYQGDLFSSMAPEAGGIFNRALANARGVLSERWKKPGAGMTDLYKALFFSGGGEFQTLDFDENGKLRAASRQPAREALQNYLMERGHGHLPDKVITALNRAAARAGTDQLDGLSRRNFVVVSKSFAPAEMDVLREFLFHLKFPNYRPIESVLRHLEDNRQSEEAFFSEIPGQKNSKYPYADFLRFSHNFTKHNLWFWNVFAGNIDRTGYSAHEEEKIDLIVPSAALLRDLGINIAQGENSPENLPPSLSGEMIMELSQSGFESCGFLEEGAGSYSKERLLACMPGLSLPD